MIFKLFANCIPVKGIKKKIVLDLQRHSYIYIPDELYEILVQFPDKSVKEIKAQYENKYDDVIEQYFDVLIKNELGFITDKPELFPDLSLDWHYPFEISNAIIDYSDISEYNLEEVLFQVGKLNCKFVQIRFFNAPSLLFVNETLTSLNRTKSNIIGVDLLIKYSKGKSHKNYLQLYKNHGRINNLVVHSSPLGKSIEKPKKNCHYIHLTDKIDSARHCGIVNKKLFTINIKNYSESHLFNSCLNGKISIDCQGHIKNCPSMTESFGNIQNTTLTHALGKESFKKYWGITKDQIDGCKDCEFRYVCTDCRAYTERNNMSDAIDLSKPLKCGYNPYTNKWSDWSTNPLKQSAIVHYAF